MISDAEMSELPVDPELAFVQFEKILRERIQEMETQEADSRGLSLCPYRKAAFHQNEQHERPRPPMKNRADHF